MKHLITGVEPNSVAYRCGLCAGDTLVTVDGQPIIDEIDYQAFSAPPSLLLHIEHANGTAKVVTLHKEEGEPLGLRFGESMALSPRTCHNKCVFCFVDQMPPGLRETLYVKDDDWRYSLMMGNFVTLTNVNETEFERIIERKASPLYVSAHTTRPDLRCRMMQNRFAGNLMQRLLRLKDAGIRFHCQIVVCPGHNDGDELLRTLQNLRSLAPAAASVAMVPVGMTKFREGLAALTPFDKAGARLLLRQIAPFQEACRLEIGTTFAFPADEFFCLADEPIPPEEWYEYYPQIENGVGLLRLLESEMEEAQTYDDEPAPAHSQRLLVACGTSAAPHMRRLTARFAPPNTTVEVLPILNHFFGETITVTGLLTGEDILAQLPASPQADTLLLSACMLRHEGDLFLDGLSLEEFTRRAPLPVQVVEVGGQALYDALHARYCKEGE